MNTIDRVRIVFEESGFSQTKLAKMFDVTPQYIWKMLNKSDEVSERMLLAIESKFPDINSEWLRTGEGEMHKILDREGEIAKITAQMFNADESSFRFRLQKIISEMSEDQIELLADIVHKLAEKENLPE